jgi:type I restriction enzyme S subunit
MSEIDRLLAEHCPDGVEVMMLGEVGTFVRGRRFTKADMVEEGVPCIHYGEIYTEYGVSARTTVSYVREDLRNQLRFAQPGDVIVAGVGETVEDVGKAVAWLGEEEVAIHDDSFLFRSELDPTYVSYYFRTSTFHAEKEQHVARAKVKRLSGNGLSRITIPVPPAEVQREIVRILDKATDLQAQLQVRLQAELQGRARQHEHYRDQLLNFVGREDVRWAALSEIATFKYGYTAKAAPIGGYRFIRITDINANGKLSGRDAKYVEASDEATEYLVKQGDLLMARTGATYGKTMLVGEDLDAVYASFLIRIRVDKSVLLPSFYWHFAQSGSYWDQANALVSTGGQPQFNANVLKTVRVAIPTLTEQARIVALLDRFDGLVSDLSSGLSAEIEARRKQYEYYRDKLLTFEERVA